MGGSAAGHSRNVSLAVFAVCHALTDFVCAFTVIGMVSLHAGSASQAAQAVLLYNFCAFMLQPFTGLIADAMPRPWLMAAAGCLMVGMGSFYTAQPFLAVALMGLGNACFHTGAGAAVLVFPDRRATAAGVLVAPGALGIAAGTLLSGNMLFLPVGLLAVMGGCAFAIALTPQPVPAGEPASDAPAFSGMLFGVVIVLLLGCAFVRSYAGFAVPAPWKATALLSFAAAVSAVLGKALGGILGDRFGFVPVTVAGLLAAAVLLPFFTGVAAAALIGIFALNLTMPIVLTVLARLFPAHIGFAFGLNSALLFPGVFFAGIYGRSWVTAGLLAGCCVVMVVCIRLLCRQSKGDVRSDNHYSA